MLSSLEGVKYVLSALNLGLLNEAIFLSKCIFLGGDDIFRLLYKMSLSLKGKQEALSLDWTFVELESALRALLRLEKESDPVAGQNNVIQFIESSKALTNIAEFIKSEEFTGQLLNLLTSR